MKNVIKCLFLIPLYMAIYFAMMMFGVIYNIAAVLVFKADEISGFGVGEVQYSLVTIFTALVSLLIYYLIIKAREIDLNKYEYNNPVRFLDVISIIFSVLSLSGIVSFIVTKIPIVRKWGEQAEEYFNFIEKENALLVILAVVVAGPIAEEVLFRGLVYSELVNAKMPKALAIITQGVLFGIMHGNLYQISYATVIGIVLGVILEKSKSIYVTVLIHIFYNFSSGIIMELVPVNIIMLLVSILLLAISLVLIRPRKEVGKASAA
ncbi:MAG: CPBP family intramembrane metalloprotease [Clostridiaceae bacterium]|nr:CPBP family intramembrane metalloprotease [Clostridiaceae bacterium]